MFEKLFSPIKIKDMELKNRIILPAMGTKFSGDGSEVTDKLIDYHVARVKGGSGLNIVEVTSVYTPAAPKRFLSLSEDEYIPGMKRLTDAIHAEGGKAGVQLWLGALAVSSDRAAQIIIPSDMPISAEITIPGMPKELIPVVVDAYGKAANRAVQAGYDCIEFHCAHTYLPHSFLSGGINRRTDEYGGSFENRAKFPLECIRAINATREAMDAALTFDREDVHRDVSKPKKLVFITGASGMMGGQTLKQLLARPNRFKVRALLRPSDKNRVFAKKHMCPALEVVWGDMSDYDTIKKCVDGCDYVLHIGAMVSPAADKYPEETLYTNIGSTLNIIKAIKEQPDPDKVHLAYVGTVAMTGSRLEPVHFGRVGDPMNPSIHDYYALSKVFTEAALYDCGLKYWVSIRQTGQHPSAETAAQEPIMFHQPPNNVLEWSTQIESGICMANLCEDWVDESFWRKAYNLSSGKEFRKTTWEFMNLNLNPMGYNFEDIYEPQQMARFNFHGQYYTDADVLENYLHFRCISGKEYWEKVENTARRLFKNPMVAAMLPNIEQLKEKNKAIASKEMGPRWAEENNKTEWIQAFYGSLEEKHKLIGTKFELHRPSEEETFLDHGYDESKDLENLTAEDLQKAAEFRGGEYLGGEIEDIYTPVKWKCAFGHEFDLSVNAALQGGHWCPECMKKSWAYPKIARKNPFYAQVWDPQHSKDETYEIPMRFSAYEIREELKKKLDL